MWNPEWVSVSNAGAEGNGCSNKAAVSADGRFVAFESKATNLVPGDTNKAWDVFLTTNPLWTPPAGP